MVLVSMVFVSSVVLTTLKGLEIVSRPDMPLQSSSLLGSLTYLGVTAIYSVLKSYWLTLDIFSSVSTHYERSSAPSSISLVYR